MFSLPFLFSILLVGSLVVSMFSMIPFQKAEAVLPVFDGETIQSELHRPAALATYDICETMTVTGFYESLSEVDNRLIWIYCEGLGSTPQTWFLFAANYTLLDSCAADSDRGMDHFCPSPPLGHIYKQSDIGFVMIDAGCEIQRVTHNSTNDIYVSNSLALGSCGTGIMTYDQAGFYWQAGTGDNIVRMINTFGMFVRMASPDLDDGGALDCDDPIAATADFDAFKIYIVCANSGNNNYLLSADLDFTSPNYVWGGKIERLLLNNGLHCAAGSTSIQQNHLRNSIFIFNCDAGNNEIIVVSHDNDGTGLTLETSLSIGTSGATGLCEPYSSNFIICGVGIDNSFNFYVYNGTAAPYLVATVNCPSCDGPNDSSHVGYNFGSTWIRPAVDNSNEAGWLVVEGVAESFPSDPLPPEDFDETCVNEEDEDCDEIPDIIDPDCDNDGIANEADTDDNGDCLISDTPPAPTVGGDDYDTGDIPNDLLDILTAGGGFSRETAGLLWTVIIHAGLFGMMLIAQAKISPGAGISASVVFIFFILAGALSLSMGFMPLVFFLAEMAVLGLGLALTTTKLITGGGGAV